MKSIRFKPAARLLQAAIVLLLAGLFSSIWPVYENAWQIALSVLLLVALIDLWRVSRIAPPQIERRIAGAVAVGVSHDVQLHIKNVSGLSLCIDIYDHFPCIWSGMKLQN